MWRFLITSAVLCVIFASAAVAEDNKLSAVDRSPVDLVVAADGSWLATANQSSDSVSLVRVTDGHVLDEVKVGRRPEAIALCGGGSQLLVSCSYSGDITILDVKKEKLEVIGRVEVGYHPHGIAVAPNENRAYVALTAASQVAVISLDDQQVEKRIEVGRWPRYLAVSPDGTRLAVGTSGDLGVSVVDTQAGKMLYAEEFVGLNIGHMQISRDGSRVWFPWVIYRSTPINPGNIRLGWVLATRVGRVRLDGRARREAISLDARGRAVGDPHGLALTSDERRLVVSASGTQELLVFRANDLPFQDYGGTDHIRRELLNNSDRFTRIQLGGRPMGLRIGPDDRTVFIANYINNSVQVVDLQKRRLVRTIGLGGPEQQSLVRRGEALFFDARLSLDQWYSCHTCHYDGGTNSIVMDTWNDHSSSSFKTVLPLYDVTKTEPWTWHGWQEDLKDAMKKSVTSTLQGEAPSDEDVEALIAYLQTLQAPPNPFRKADGSLTAEAERGKRIFLSSDANCTSCHSGSLFTDGEVHDVGTGTKSDKLEGFNTPSLIGIHAKLEFLHDGRAKSLHDLLSGPHRPSLVSGTRDFKDNELDDLIEYLKTL